MTTYYCYYHYYYYYYYAGADGGRHGTGVQRSTQSGAKWS